MNPLTRVHAFLSVQKSCTHRTIVLGVFRNRSLQISSPAATLLCAPLTSHATKESVFFRGHARNVLAEVRQRVHRRSLSPGSEVPLGAASRISQVPPALRSILATESVDNNAQDKKYCKSLKCGFNAILIRQMSRSEPIAYGHVEPSTLMPH